MFIRSSQPLEGFKIVIVGELNKSKPVLTKIVHSLGGEVINDVDSSTTLCISSKGVCMYVCVCAHA